MRPPAWLVALLARRQPDPEVGLRLLAEEMARQGGRQIELMQVFEQAARDNRLELHDGMRDLGHSLTQQGGQQATLQARRLDALAQRLDSLRDTLDSQLQHLRIDNARQLDAMRRTVDEQLQQTLETRLGESFRLVSERLEQVQRGLGEMQRLAGDVGDLKRVLNNVKTRGIWGEAQLAAILEQMFTPAQYAGNVEIVPNSGERVEFAIRLPGASDSAPIWLPIDAKFPREDYERLLAAQEAGDGVLAEQNGRRLETRLRTEARAIGQKYISPPASTDFGILFVPVEGLFAELARRPGLMDELHRQHRVLLAGPTTLAAILSSLQMGFRTLAVEQRSSEIRRLLGSVKAEFNQFGEILAKTRDQLEKAAGTIGHAQTRTRVIARQLTQVENTPQDVR
ncbi:MAG: DNA recombination protein RmuC, partial [Burkholderiaceae bacterium]